MTEKVVTAQHMEALQALADTNLKISESRALLTTLEEAETKYLVERERMATTRITEVLEASREVVLETKANYDEVQRFHGSVVAFADFLRQAYARFEAVVTLFDEKSRLWTTNIERQEAEIAEIRKLFSVDRAKIANEKKNIEVATKDLENGNRKLEDDRGTLERAIKRLKENNI